jgi:hypothetical protein
MVLSPLPDDGTQGDGEQAAKGLADQFASAVKKDQMITPTESNIRQSLGVVFFVLYAWQSYLLSDTGNIVPDILKGTILGNDYLLLSVLSAAAYGMWESGRQSL